MATKLEYIEYVLDQISGIGELSYKKMFGEYMVYINSKPLIIVCNDTCFVKILDVTEKFLKESPKGYPYKGAKEHYILDIDNSEFCKEVLIELEKVIPIPKKKSKNKN